MSKGKTIVMWVITILLTCLFLFAGLTKLLMPDKMMSQWIYARWFLTFVGACETLGAIGLLIPRLAIVAAAGLCGIMIGAVYTVIHVHMLNQVATPIITFILLIVVIQLRRQQGKSISA